MDKLIDEIAEKHYQQAALSPAFVGHRVESYKAAIAEYAQLAAEQGVFVPLEPTEEMLEAAQECDTEGEDDALRAYAMIYKAMLAAAKEEQK